MQIYFGHPQKITSSHATPFSKATSEARCLNHRGVEPAHILYMAMKVIQFNVGEKTVTFHTNDVTSTITRRQLESGDFVRDALDRDMAFMRGVPNTVHYWQQCKKEVFAMTR